VSDTSSISSGVAAPYATALFDLSKEADKLPAIEALACCLKKTVAKYYRECEMLVT